MPDDASRAALSRGAGLKPSELLPACVDIIDTYEPTKTTIDAHHGDYCARHRITDEQDVMFLHQVLYGTHRYKKLLKVFLSSFYYNHAHEAARSDAALYQVLAYLAILRLEELGFAQFKRLVLSQDFVKTRVFLRFLFNEESLNKWLKEGWLTLYEPHYVQNELIDEVMKFEPAVRGLVEELDRRQAMGEAKRAAEAEAAAALAAGRGGTGKHTTPEPFNLTQPQPRLVPEPTQTVELRGAQRQGEGAEHEFKATRWVRRDGPTKDQLELDAKKEENRLELRRKYAGPNAGRFDLAAEKRPSKLGGVKAELAEREAEAHTFKPAPPKPVPKWDADQGFVKLNAAAILREDQIYRRKQAEEARLIAGYEEDLRDAKEYDRWVETQRARAEAERAAALEARRVETQLADEAAKASMEKSKLRKRHVVTKMRLEASAVSEEVERQKAADVAARREQAAAIGELRERGAQAVAEVEARRREAAEAVREESKALEAERRRALAEEEERRQEVIREIRALELVPRTREKVLDPTYSAGHGLLDEMSLAELRERLALAQARHAQDLENKRAEIVREKQAKEQTLKSKAAAIAGYRRLGAQQAEAARAREREQRSAKAEAELRRREEASLKLEAAREAIRNAGRAEEARLAAELKQIKVKNQFLGADREAVEAKKFHSLERGAQREAKTMQRAGQDAAALTAEIRGKELTQRERVAAAGRRAHAEWSDNQALRFTNATYDAELTAAHASELKAETVLKERAARAGVRAAHDDAYPYTAAIAQETRESAHAFGARRDARTASAARARSRERRRSPDSAAGGTPRALGGGFGNTGRGAAMAAAPPAGSGRRRASGGPASEAAGAGAGSGRASFSQSSVASGAGRRRSGAAEAGARATGSGAGLAGSAALDSAALVSAG